MDRVKLKCVIKMLKKTLEIIQLICNSIKVKRVLEMLKITFRSINLNDFSKNIISLLRFPPLHFAYFPNPKNASRVRRGWFWRPPYLVVFLKRYFLERVKPFLLWLLMLSLPSHFLKISVKFLKSFIGYEDFPLQSRLFYCFFFFRFFVISLLQRN